MLRPSAAINNDLIEDAVQRVTSQLQTEFSELGNSGAGTLSKRQRKRLRRLTFNESARIAEQHFADSNSGDFAPAVTGSVEEPEAKHKTKLEAASRRH